ncbi:hypothetical protein SLEP1_g59130 [Rubroshorea leprosula]|uniref:Uncharacterized protein n=1 Tax=Rubroshorea leprosula TaxID=152421 RepID=A0AAV5MRF3_9ROSI|nr:hypothetical protein SLEP1_g59130 [Rubroshorea leprosula]
MRRRSHHEEGDEQHSSNTLPKDDEARRSEQSDGSGVGKMSVVINFIPLIALAVLGQLNSNPKPLYSFILMLLSLASLCLWIIALKYRSKGKTAILGLVSTICQSLVAAANWVLLVMHRKTQIQTSAWPILFASVVLYSAFQRNRTQTDQPHRVQLQPLQSIVIDKPTSEYQESFTRLQDHAKATRWRYLLVLKITIEQAFAIFNLMVEFTSAIFDLLSSEPKPLYALILMLLPFVSLLLCLYEVYRKGKTERVTWSFWDKVGLICAVVQPIPSTFNFALVRQQKGQVQISVLPLVFALALSCSEVWESPNMTGSEGNIDEEEQVVPINQKQGVTEVSTLKKESESTASEEGKSGLPNQSQLGGNEEVSPKKEKSVVKDDNKMAPKTEDSWDIWVKWEPVFTDTPVSPKSIRVSSERRRIRRPLLTPGERMKALIKEIRETLFTDEIWPLAKNEESVRGKKKELMREPTRRKTDTILRRRRDTGRHSYFN